MVDFYGTVNVGKHTIHGCYGIQKFFCGSSCCITPSVNAVVAMKTDELDCGCNKMPLLNCHEYLNVLLV